MSTHLPVSITLLTISPARSLVILFSFHNSPLSFYSWEVRLEFDLRYPDKGFNFDKIGVSKKSADGDFPGGWVVSDSKLSQQRVWDQSLVGELRFLQPHSMAPPKKSEKMPEIYVKEIIVKVRPGYINMKMLSHLPPPPLPVLPVRDSRLGTCPVPATSQAKCWTSPPLRPALPAPDPDGL